MQVVVLQVPTVRRHLSPEERSSRDEDAQMAFRYVMAAWQNQEDVYRSWGTLHGAPRPAHRYQLHDAHHQASQMQQLSPVKGRPYMQKLEMPDPVPAAKKLKAPGCTVKVSGVQVWLSPPSLSEPDKVCHACHQRTGQLLSLYRYLVPFDAMKGKTSSSGRIHSSLLLMLICYKYLLFIRSFP